MIKQCPEFARYNESSVNVLRITSVMWKGHVYILTVSLRVGAVGSFCDHCNNDKEKAFQIPVNIDGGTFMPRAIEADTLDFYDSVHGAKIEGSVPKYDEMIEKIKKAHARYPDYGIIGWDVTVDSEGDIVLIEFNISPAFVGIQYQHGPVMMKKTVDGVPLLDEILAKPLDYKKQVLI